MTQEELVTDTLSGWEDLVSTPLKFLKADDLQKGETFVVISKEIKQWDDDERPKLRLHLESSKKIRYAFDCNATNTNFLASSCGNPDEVVGKKINFEKVKVFSPHHKKEVDSLRITEVS